jgi:hypothetical protein
MSRPILLLLFAGAACVSNNYNYGVSATESPGTGCHSRRPTALSQPRSPGRLSGPGVRSPASLCV